MKTVLSVVGARPQFIKAAPLSRRLREDFREILVHTGQHYDHGMSGAFFEELGIPEPELNLGVGSGSHAAQTRGMAEGLATAMRDMIPDVVLAYGDTNSTLAAGLAAESCGIPLVHVEAGLRSRNPGMPEEINRIVADHLSDLCLAPTAAAMENLEREGLAARAVLVGDVMLDACLSTRRRAGEEVPARFGLTRGQYYFATVHRAENTNAGSKLSGILSAFAGLPLPVVFPVHPRTRAALVRHGLDCPANVMELPPVSHLESIGLVSEAAMVLTDLGGLQKEAGFLGVPCVTLREETEWVETVETGWNVLAGSDPGRIRAAVAHAFDRSRPPDLEAYGSGQACDRIAEALVGRY